MKPANKCAVAAVSVAPILPISDWGIQHAAAQQSKEQSRPASQSRADYQKRIQAKLDDLAQRISALEAREETQATQARRELRKQLRDLTRQHQAAARQYEELKQESQEAWRKMKPKMDATLDELEKAYRNLASRFQEH
jgi:Zn-dependent M32 family carboxypeptidase